MSSSDEDAEVVVAESYTVSLDSFPIEVILMIFDHVDADTLLRSLMFVNKHFYDLISDNYLWKKRAGRKFNGSNVAFMSTSKFNENTFNWKQFVWHTELEEDCWSDYQTNTTTSVFYGAHFSEVDAVALTQEGNLCLSASRDRSICLWNSTDKNSIPVSTSTPVVHKIDSHTGWIWDLNIYNENHFLSCSWDSSIKLWNMDDFSRNPDPVQTFNADMAVLSITSKDNFVAAGLYSPKVVAFDPREHEKRLFELRNHTRSIIDLCLVEDNYLISLSEDKTLSIWDLRTCQTLKSLRLTKHGNRFPMCASYYDNVLFIGDSKDYMHWLDCSNGTFDLIKTIKFVRPNVPDNQRNKLNCIKCTNYGSIITGGNEGAIYIVAPTDPPKIIAKIDDYDCEITSIDYQHNTLAVGYVNCDVRIFRKK